MSLFLSSSLEDYLEKIYELNLRKGEVHAVDIANELKVKKPSVTSALKKLAAKNLINYERYKTITLTGNGEVLAAEISTRHKVLRNFFENVLEIEHIQADSLACSIEHSINKEVVKKLSAFEFFVSKCTKMNYKWVEEIGRFCGSTDGNNCEPCDNVCESYINKVNKDERMKFNLKDLTPGKKGRIIQISEDSRIRRKLAEMGVTRGCSVEMIRVAPLGDPIEIKIRGYQLTLRKEEAKHIFIEAE